MSFRESLPWNLIICLTIAACSGDATEPQGPDLQAFVGKWRVEVGPQSGCWDQLEFWFTIDQDDVPVPAPNYDWQDYFWVMSDWSWSEDLTDPLLLSGTLRPVSGSFVLNFMVDPLNDYLEFEGTIEPGPRLDGILWSYGDGFRWPEWCYASAVAVPVR